jgi:signal transduction histidine kinase
VAVGLTGLGTVGLVRAFADPLLVAIPPLTDIFEDLGLDFRLMIAVALATPFAVAVVVCGLVFWRRSHDPMALLFTMTLLAFVTFGSRSLVTFEGDPTLRHATPIVFGMLGVGVALVLGLFPSGTFVPRSVRWLTPVVTALVLALPGGGNQLDSMFDGDVEVSGRARTVLLGMFAALLLGLLAQTYRYRRVSNPAERQQTKWVVLPLGLLFVVVAVAATTSLALPTGSDRWVGWTLFVSIPISILFQFMVANAVLRYRLYDIDLVINRTVLFGLLAAFITLVYSVTVVGLTALGTGDDLGASIAATAIVALAFEPVRVRAQRWADRVAYGKRATPYEVLSDLTHRLPTTESAQGLLDRVARRLADGTGAERAGVWITRDSRYTLAGRWPAETGVTSVSSVKDLPGTVVEIDRGGEQLGALTVEKRRGDAVTPTETRLIRDLAGSASTLLQNLGLQSDLEASAEELEASRRRLFDVQVLERRRLERDLDEGAQQLVVSLKVKLNVASRLARAEGVEPLAVMLEGMDQDARGAITQIRSLARGLYPQLLEEEGVVAAVRSLSEDAAVPVEVEANEVGRLPTELEAAVFFCISEAITNAAKHAPGGVVNVRIEQQDGHLAFSVQDHGPGFDLATIKAGSGLRNMADRLEANGGRLAINSRPGHGTTITGRIPTHQPITV